MELTPAQEQIIQEWFDDHSYLPDACPACGLVDDDGDEHIWEIGALIAAPLVNRYCEVRSDAYSVAMIQMLCLRCRYVLLYDAEQINGLFR